MTPIMIEETTSEMATKAISIALMALMISVTEDMSRPTVSV